MTKVQPAVSYEDVGAAIEFLTRAFGFEELERYEDDGRVTHALLRLDGEVLHVGWPGPDYRSPKSHAETCEQARSWLAMPYVIDGVIVDLDEGLDELVERARSAGAEILRGPDDEPYGRMVTAADPEGHRWMFVQPA